MPVDRITSADVLGCLAPIWTSKPAAARKARNRIAAVFRWCIGRNHRADNPVDRAVVALPRANGHAPRHYRALPHREVAAALEAIRRVRYIHPSAVLCVEMIALTAVRAGEARGARWDEIDMEAATWTIPASRMKAGREFSVPWEHGRARRAGAGAGAVPRVVVGVSLEDRRAVAEERAGARASPRRSHLDGSRVPFERAVVDGRVRRPGGGRGGLPRPCPEKPSRSGVSEVRPAGAPRRGSPGMERIHQVAKLLPRRLVSTHIPGGPVRQPVAQSVVVGLLLSVLNRIRCGSTETAPPGRLRAMWR